MMTDAAGWMDDLTTDAAGWVDDFIADDDGRVAGCLGYCAGPMGTLQCRTVRADSNYSRSVSR